MIKIEELLLQGEQVSVKATGRSMRPTFRDKMDFVTLTPCDTGSLEVGEVVFFNRGDQYCLHRIIRINGDDLVIRGDGNQPGALERVKRSAVIAKVTEGTMYGGRKFCVEDEIWKRNTRLVLRFYPLIALWHRFTDIVRHYPMSALVVVLLLYLSFMNTESIDIDVFDGADKVVHVIMYFGVSLVFWFEWMRFHGQMTRKQTVKGVVFCLAVPIALGGAIELAQEYLTGGMRSGDIYDFLSDVAGVVIATMVSFAVTQPVLRSHQNKKRL